MIGDRQKLVAAYLQHGKTPTDELAWAFEATSDLVRTGGFEELWLLCLDLIASIPEHDDALLAYVAAGPLEDLLRSAGQHFADRVEERARQDARFRRALTGVWGRSEQPQLWKRLTPLLTGVPNPL